MCIDWRWANGLNFDSIQLWSPCLCKYRTYSMWEMWKEGCLTSAESPDSPAPSSIFLLFDCADALILSAGDRCRRNWMYQWREFAPVWSSSYEITPKTSCWAHQGCWCAYASTAGIPPALQEADSDIWMEQGDKKACSLGNSVLKFNTNTLVLR